MKFLRDAYSLVFLALLVGSVLITGCDDSQPPKPQPASLAPTVGSIHGGDSIAIVGQAFTEGSLVLFDGVPADEVYVSAGVITAKTPAHAEGTVVVQVYNATGGFAEVPNGFEYVTPVGREGNPRLVGAISLSNTSVRLTFNEPVLEGAGNSESYSIVQANINSESGALRIVDVDLAQDGLSVLITTGSQNEVVYDLIASGIRDLEGNLLATPEPLVNPSQVQFGGSPPSGPTIDTDGDGLADSAEQNGWTVTVHLSNGDIMQTTVTSDPTIADTDEDGLGDAQELLSGSNPRNSDTDGDTIIDLVEIVQWHSSPTKQDTDGDGLSDAGDLVFETSLILADTDGDSMDDREELFLFNRNPLMADLPRPQIVVGDYSLQVEVSSSYTDVTGVTRSSQSTLSSGVSQAQSRALNRSDTRSTESANKSSTEFGGEVGYSSKDGFAGKANFNQGFEQSTARGFSSTVDTQTASESQQTFENSVSEAFDVSELQSVTRSIDSAQVQATINVANQGEVPFTITNLEISLQRQDRSTGGSFTPVATLRPSGGQALSLNLGPFDSERGPIIFENTDIFPNVVEELIREPQGLVFKVANFDVLDAQGNNFAFSSATVSSRTVGLTVDYGDGRVENFRIATHNSFGADGLPTGITMQRAMELAGLNLLPDDATLPDPLPVTLGNATTGSVGTLREGINGMGTERLVRVRGVQNDLRDLDFPEKKFWTIQTNNPNVDPDEDFSTIQLRAGDEFLLLFTRDLDQDGLHELEENFYGSSDNNLDSDGDGLSDAEEVRIGWTVQVKPGSPLLVFSSPGRNDSDLDGLTDDEERANLTNPNKQDTDNDGLSDRQEILDTLILPLGDPGSPNPIVLRIEPYTDAGVFALQDGTVVTGATGDDVQLIAIGDPANENDLIIGPGANGRIDTEVSFGGIEAKKFPQHIVAGPNNDTTLATGDSRCETAVDPASTDIEIIAPGTVVPEGTICIAAGAPSFQIGTRVDFTSTDFVREGHEGLFATDPTRADTDFDGIPDGRETRVGLNLNFRDAGNVLDTDNDGLRDAEEENGWLVCTKGVFTAEVCVTKFPNKILPDTDFDGLPDVLEFAIGSDPTERDTDGDQLSDLEEFDAANPIYGTIRNHDPAALLAAVTRCIDATECTVPSTTLTSTSLNHQDTDGDFRSDFEEENIGYVVNVPGAVRTVYSLPNFANSDTDSLDDRQEFFLAGQTDPTDPDSDDDGTNDGIEGARGRNPLVPDKRIRLNNMIVHVIGGCDGSSTDPGEFNGGQITLAVAGSSPVVLGTFASCNGVTLGTDCSGPTNSSAFLLETGESFDIRSAAGLNDSDGTCALCSAPEDLDTFSSSYTFDSVAGGTVTEEVNETPAITTPADCQLTFEYTIQVD